MCRKGAWVELTVEVTSVEDRTTQTARIFLFHGKTLSVMFFIYRKNFLKKMCIKLNTYFRSGKIKSAYTVRSDKNERIRIT